MKTVLDYAKILGTTMITMEDKYPNWRMIDDSYKLTACLADSMPRPSTFRDVASVTIMFWSNKEKLKTSLPEGKIFKKEVQ